MYYFSHTHHVTSCDMTHDIPSYDCDLYDTCDVTLSCTPSCVISPKEKKK